jgi:phenylacetic acid degradation operon negative regulatory protein
MARQQRNPSPRRALIWQSMGTADHTPEPKQSRTLLVSLLGAFGRRADDWLPISGIIALMGELDLDESSVRTGVSRLKKRHWLVPEKRGTQSGYRLTAVARQAIEAGDRVIWHARQPADLADGWCIANFSVPEADRARRHLLRSRLAGLGFGNVGQGVWIAPARMLDDALTVIHGLELQDNTVVFVGAYKGGQDLRTLVHECWDFAEMNANYGAFIEAHKGDPDVLARHRTDADVERESFVLYLRAIDDWRRLPLRDPGLPREMMGPDWVGDHARELFERLTTELDQAAVAYVRRRLDS